MKLIPDSIIKKDTIYSNEGDWKYAKLSWCVEKPPVAMVDIPWFMASNRFIPPNHRDAEHTAVRNKYKPHSQRAVVLMRGCSFPVFNPVASAENNFKSPIPI